jgi:hypothetical protein
MQPPNPNPNHPLSEQYRLAAIKWTDADSAADLLESTKSAVFSQRVNTLMEATPKLSTAKAETMVRASMEWWDHVRKIVAARKHANLLRVDVRVIEMKHREWISDDANKRAESRL